MTDKERARSTAQTVRRDLLQAGINVIPAGVDPAYGADLIDSRYAAAILRAEAEALEGVYQLIGSHSGLDARIVVLHAAAAELEEERG